MKLVDIEKWIKHDIDPVLKMILAFDETNFKKIDTGIYEAPLNWSNHIKHVTVDCEYRSDDPAGFPYGVADNHKQIVNVFCKLKSHGDYSRYFILMTPIVKSKQPGSGGWRWHKWGEYIGDHEITREYLYDEELIDKVYVYQIYRLKSGIKDNGI